MKYTTLLLAATALTPYIDSAIALPPTVQSSSHSGLDRRVADVEHVERSIDEELWKRKGGGGGGGRGGSSGGSSGGSGGSSGGSRGGLGSSGSNTGGRTNGGSGAQPSYAGGRYYGGGATQPYRAGSSAGSIVPFALAGGAFGFLGAYWALSYWNYPYTHRYYYHNSTTNKNETKPVTCVCQQYEECGCDDNGDQAYFNSIIGNGTYSSLNQSLVTVAPINGTDTILINGTLPNGTTASGGDEDPYDDAAGGMHNLLRAAGWWPLVTTALALAYMV